MNVTHHLTDETMHEYASGTLDSSMETLIACHLTVCQYCRSRADQADQIGGLLLAEADSAAVRVTAADLLARGTSHTAPATPPPAPLAVGVPRPLARLLPGPVDQLQWRRIAPGVKQYNLSEQPRTNGAFKLLHLAPGVTRSDHSHSDRELTYVVRGSYTDEMGRFSSGDIADLDGNHSHKPVVDSEEPCIALIASGAPVQYSGILGRIMQPFVGI